MSGIPLDSTDWAAADTRLHQAMGRARNSWRKRVLLQGAAWTATALLVALVVLALVGARGSVTPATYGTLRIVFWGVGIAALGWWVARPLMRSVSESSLARYLEEQDPALGETLITAVDAISKPVSERTSPPLVGRLASKATDRLADHDDGATLERPRIRNAAMHLGAALLASFMLLQFGPGSWRNMAHGLLTPWTPAKEVVPDRFVTVEPGNMTVARGSSLDLTARTTGFAPEDAVVLVRKLDATEWTTLPMLADSAGYFSIRLFDLDESTAYRVEAGRITSPEYQITVTDLPAVRQLDLELNFPDYTALPSETQEDGGDVAALIGTRVTIEAQVTMPISGAVLRFDDGKEVPFEVSDSGLPMASFKVTENTFYSIDLVAPDGTLVPGTIRWAVDALPDRAPVVRVFEPGRDSKASNVEEVALSVGADDDYGVDHLELHFSVNGGSDTSVMLSNNLAPGTLTPRAVHTMYLEEYELQPGDLVAYHARAVDGAGNEAQSDMYFIEIRPFSLNYRQAEQGGAPPPGGGQGGEEPQDLSRMQREVVVATFNLARDSADTETDRLKQDIATVGVEQESVRKQIADLATQIGERSEAAQDSTFAQVKVALDSATVLMKESLKALTEQRLRDAMPWQQRALQQLLRSESLYRDIELQLNQNQQGGGGGGGGAAPEDLADLFELETDKLRNQYEEVQRQSSAAEQGAAAIDSARERLRELARRLQQENERQRQMADALQQRMGQQGGQGGQAGAGGAGGAQSGAASAQQRRLAQEAEEEARRLERLAREQQNPQLEQAAQSARQAADALRRAANGESNRAQDAAESLRQAAQSAGQGKQSAAEQQAQKAADAAEALARDQAKFTRDAMELPVPGSGERAQAAEKLQKRGEQLVDKANRLTESLDAASRTLKGTDPGVAEAMSDAAGRLRRMQVTERMRQGAQLVGADRFPPTQIKRFNDQVTEVLQDVSDSVRVAAGRVGNSPVRQREQAMERARELVRGMESMRDRAASQAGRDSLAAGSGTVGQSGESGEQASGQGQGEGEAQQGQGQGEAQGQGRGQGQAQQGQGGNPQGGNQNPIGGDARQLSGEVRLRLREAQRLGGQLSEQGVELESLNDAIAAMQRLLREGTGGDPMDLANLQEQVLNSLQDAEFDLWRRWGGGSGSRPAVGDPSRVPPRFRQMVEEYYRSIARDRP